MAVELRPTVGPYRLGPLLGRGGMAVVYGATRVGAAGFSRPVCLKLILPHLATETSFRNLFVHEARVSGTLVHGNLVQVFDCVQDEAGLALVMELVDGLDLRRLLEYLHDKRRPFPPRLVAQVAGQVLAALHYVHEHGIVHRDVTPHNIMISRAGEVKLADFGVAKAAVSQATGTGTVKGKLAYMSPEQASGGGVDGRTDLFSLGLVLFELLTGRRFFDQKYPAEIVAAVGRAEPPELPTTEPELARVVAGLLQPDRDRRLQTAAAALAALPSWRESGPWGALQLGALVGDANSHSGPLDQLAYDEAASDFGPGPRDARSTVARAAYAQQSRWAPPVLAAGPQEPTATRSPWSGFPSEARRREAAAVGPDGGGAGLGANGEGLDVTPSRPEERSRQRWLTLLRIGAWCGTAALLTIVAVAWGWRTAPAPSQGAPPLHQPTTEADEGNPLAKAVGQGGGVDAGAGAQQRTAGSLGHQGDTLLRPHGTEARRKITTKQPVERGMSVSPRRGKSVRRRSDSAAVTPPEAGRDGGHEGPATGAIAAEVNPFRRSP